MSTRLLQYLNNRIENQITSSLCEVCFDLGASENVSYGNEMVRILQLSIKRGLDIVFSSVLLFFTLPFFIIIAIVIRLNSPGPVFFKQKRIGYLNREFTIYKFRTMYHGADNKKHEEIIQDLIKEETDEKEDVQALVKFFEYIEKRTTRVGQFLRKTSLDELPQLFNILIGQMSLVGPRPHPVYEVNKYKEWYYRRLCVKPGLTGWSKLNLRLTPKNYEEAILYDLWYVDHWSIQLDLQILFMTIPFVLSTEDAH